MCLAWNGYRNNNEHNADLLVHSWTTMVLNSLYRPLGAFRNHNGVFKSLYRLLGVFRGHNGVQIIIQASWCVFSSYYTNLLVLSGTATVFKSLYRPLSVFRDRDGVQVIIQTSWFFSWDTVWCSSHHTDLLAF